MNLTKNEAKIFGKVLIEIGESICNNPEVLLDLISSLSKKDDKECIISDEAKKLSLIEFKDTKNEILNKKLKEFNLQELREIIKNNRIGSIKSKNTEKLIEHILNFRQKNSQGIFLNYKTSEEE